MLFYHFAKINKVFAYDSCDGGCPDSYCGCSGSCFGETTHEECGFTQECSCSDSLVEYWGCTDTYPCGWDCWTEEIPPACYYSAGCYSDCEDYGCGEWICGGCVDGVKCCNCTDPGNYGYTCKTCSIDSDDPNDNDPGWEDYIEVLTCTVSALPETLSIPSGNFATVLATVSEWVGNLQDVNFTSSNTNVGTINPSSDSTNPYSTEIAGLNPGNTNITANVSVSGAVRCSDTIDVSVTPPGPWWQAKDSDIFSGSYLTSIIPINTTNKYLILDGSGGFPGVPFYYGDLHLGSGTASSKGWIVNSSSSGIKSYNYSTLVRQIPSDVTFNPVTTNSITQTDLLSTSSTNYKDYYWFKYDGAVSGSNLSIDSDINLEGRKVVLLVEGADLNINGKINLTNGTGFFAVLVGKTDSGENGNIVINSSVGGTVDEVPELEGIFLADNQIKTGSGNTQLHIRGSVASLSGTALERDLDDNSQNPAEFFEFAPDQILLFPSQLNIRKYQWKEISP